MHTKLASIATATVLSLAGIGARAAEAPKLTEVTPPAVVVDGEATARPLPRTLVICIDRGQRRCWGGEHAADCEGGQVFATTPAEGGDPGGLLRSCLDQVR